MVEWNLLHKFSHLLCSILIEVDVALTRSYVVDTCHLVKPQFIRCNSISAAIFISHHFKSLFPELHTNLMWTMGSRECTF